VTDEPAGHLAFVSMSRHLWGYYWTLMDKLQNCPKMSHYSWRIIHGA